MSQLRGDYKSVWNSLSGTKQDAYLVVSGYTDELKFHADAEDTIDILRETWSTFLDPSLNPPEIRPWGSKALINACMDYKFIKSFSPRTKLDKSTV